MKCLDTLAYRKLPTISNAIIGGHILAKTLSSIAKCA